MRSRMRLMGVLAVGLIALGFVASTTSSVRGRQLAPGPVPLAQSTFEVVDPPNPAELVQALLEFPVGAVVPPHTHGGAAYITMLDGELTVLGPDGTVTIRAGDTLVEQPGLVYAAHNSGATPASLVVTYLVPKGAPVTTLVPGPPNP